MPPGTPGPQQVELHIQVHKVHILVHNKVHIQVHTTKFQFMENKQFGKEKRLGTSVCADIFYNILLKTDTFNFYMKKSLNKKIVEEHFGFLSVFESNSAPENSFLD